MPVPASSAVDPQIFPDLRSLAPIYPARAIAYIPPSRPLQGGVDRNQILRRKMKPRSDVAPFRGRGSKRLDPGACATLALSPPSGGVDRNLTAAPNNALAAGRPLQGGRGSKRCSGTWRHGQPRTRSSIPQSHGRSRAVHPWPMRPPSFRPAWKPSNGPIGTAARITNRGRWMRFRTENRPRSNREQSDQTGAKLGRIRKREFLSD